MKIDLSKNNLINSSNPYLFCHATNPVHWQIWSEDIIQLAKKMNKILLISSGYSSCHWCHVMNKESFSNSEVAEIMNQHFINIKIDREERPDLDNLYMKVVQSLTGHGGWPLNVFLLPDGRPFWGGTYFPIEPKFNLPSWKELLLNIQNIFLNNPQKLITTAQNLEIHFANIAKNSNKIDDNYVLPNFKSISPVILDNLIQHFDNQHGGFGIAPKFPNFSIILWLFRYHYYNKDKTSIQVALFSLNSILKGGIYDQIEGGIFRYSTDAKWQIPHFEKMLYDNAQLLWVLSEAYAITKNPIYKNKCQETIQLLQKYFLAENGGYYTAYDADSNGIEGDYYTLNWEEASSILTPDELLIISQYFNWEKGGNWENTNHHWCSELNIKNDLINKCINKIKLARTNKKIPFVDKKILTQLNGLLLGCLCQVYKYIKIPNLWNIINELAQFIKNNLINTTTLAIYHGLYPDFKIISKSFVEDYSYICWGFIQFQQIGGSQVFLELAKIIFQETKEKYLNKTSNFYQQSTKQVTGFNIDYFELQDSPIISPNAILYSVEYFFNRLNNKISIFNSYNDYLKINPLARQNPIYYSGWNLLQFIEEHGFTVYYIPLTKQLDLKNLIKNMYNHYNPNLIVLNTEIEQSKVLPKFPILKVCNNFSCFEVNIEETNKFN